jgi:hypothetical protein
MAALDRLPDVQKDYLRKQPGYGRSWKRVIGAMRPRAREDVFVHLRQRFPPTARAARRVRRHRGAYPTASTVQSLQLPVKFFPTAASVRAWIRASGKDYRMDSIERGGPRSRFWHVRQINPTGLPIVVYTLPDGVELVLELHSRT